MYLQLKNGYLCLNGKKYCELDDKGKEIYNIQLKEIKSRSLSGNR